jgi:hypothetical protein
MAISRFSASRLTQGLPKYQSAWDQDNVAQGAVEVITTLRLTSPANNLTFNSIPQTYQHLMLHMDVRGTDSFTINLFSVYLNATGPTLTSKTTLYSDGSSVGSYRYTTSTPTYGHACQMPGGTSTNGIFGTTIIYIPNYTNTTTNKTVIGKDNSHVLTEGRIQITATNHGSNSAVTRLDFGSTANWAAGCMFTLYGIKGA